MCTRPQCQRGFSKLTCNRGAIKPTSQYSLHSSRTRTGYAWPCPVGCPKEGCRYRWREFLKLESEYLHYLHKKNTNPAGVRNTKSIKYIRQYKIQNEKKIYNKLSTDRLHVRHLSHKYTSYVISMCAPVRSEVTGPEDLWEGAVFLACL